MRSFHHIGGDYHRNHRQTFRFHGDIVHYPYAKRLPSARASARNRWSIQSKCPKSSRPDVFEPIRPAVLALEPRFASVELAWLAALAFGTVRAVIEGDMVVAYVLEPVQSMLSAKLQYTVGITEKERRNGLPVYLTRIFEES